jgi:hypothetical protein
MPHPYFNQQAEWDPEMIDKTTRGAAGRAVGAGPGGPTMGLGGSAGPQGVGFRNPFQTMFAPWKRRYGQAYGGMAGRGQPSTSAPASSFYSGARQPTPMASLFDRVRGGGILPKAPNGGPSTGFTTGTEPGSIESIFDTAFAGGGSANYSNLTSAIIRQMIAAGMLNPMGSPGMIAALRGQAIGDADALRARQNTMAGLAGLDPAQAASKRFEADMGLQGEIQRMLLNARLQSMLQNRELLTGVMGKGMGYNWMPKQT